MVQLSHSKIAILSGAIWMAVGIFLLQLGLTLLFLPTSSLDSTPLLNLFSTSISPSETAVIITALALYIGFLKGKYVLTKTANRTLSQIRLLPNPAPIHKIYDKKYYMLLGIMILLGISIKYMGIPNDVRGAIDIIIGSALINGAAHYFRMSAEIHKEQKANVY